MPLVSVLHRNHYNNAVQAQIFKTTQQWSNEKLTCTLKRKFCNLQITISTMLNKTKEKSSVLPAS